MPPPGPADERGFLDLLPASTSQRLLTDSRRRYPQGATLFTDGDVAGDVHVILSGRVKVLTDTLVGRPVLLALRGPGDLVGELAAFDGGRRSATAVTLEDSVTVSLTVDRFRALLLAHPDVTLHLLSLTAQRLRDADAKRVEYTALDSGGRVARRLVELGEGWGQQVPEGLLIDLGLTQDEIASWTGASREALTRALASFRSRGWISTDRRRVLILDIEAMRKRGS